MHITSICIFFDKISPICLRHVFAYFNNAVSTKIVFTTDSNRIMPAAVQFGIVSFLVRYLRLYI